MDTPTIDEIRERLEDALGWAEALNAQGSDKRCRELSIAITKIEEALHWLGDVERFYQ